MSLFDIARRRRCWPWFYTAVPAPGSGTAPLLLVYKFPSGGGFLTNTGTKAGFNLSAADICGG